MGEVKSWASILDEATRQQAEVVSRAPGLAGHLALMPDAHLGIGATVGSVIPTWSDTIIPAAVGVDSGCGMIAARTDLVSLPDDLRRRIDGKPLHGRRGSRARRSVGVSNRGYSRWSLLDAAAPEEDMADALARQLLRRYGVLCPEILARETNVPRWRELVRLLRRMEARGEIRGGRFVAGYVGEQFALPEAVEMLRAERYSEDKGRWVVVAACDPLNWVGVLTPGERVPATLGNRVAFRDGVPMCSLQGGVPVPLATLDPGTLEHATSLLLARPRRDREDGSKAPVGFRGRWR